MQALGHNCLVTRRSVNKGFKAGNMINGMTYLQEVSSLQVPLLESVRVKPIPVLFPFTAASQLLGMQTLSCEEQTCTLLFLLCTIAATTVQCTRTSGCAKRADVPSPVQVPWEFVAVFDADFEMPADFLYQTIWHMQQDSRLGFVQTRWSFTNGYENMLCW